MKTKAKRRAKVKVTAEHIKNGRRSDCSSCAIALALKDEFGGEWHVWFRDAVQDAFLTRNPRRIRFTPRVRSLQRALDRGEPVMPFEF